MDKMDLLRKEIVEFRNILEKINNEEYLVVHIISDETGKNICDVKLSLQEVLNLVEYAIKDIFKRLENNVKNKTEKRDVL